MSYLLIGRLEVLSTLATGALERGLDGYYPSHIGYRKRGLDLGSSVLVSIIEARA